MALILDLHASMEIYLCIHVFIHEDVYPMCVSVYIIYALCIIYTNIMYVSFEIFVFLFSFIRSYISFYSNMS
jgi:hypothetical protein